MEGRRRRKVEGDPYAWLERESGPNVIGIKPEWMPEPGECGFCDLEKDQVSVRECVNGEAVCICLDCCQANFGRGFEGLWAKNIQYLQLEHDLAEAYRAVQQTGTVEEYGAFRAEYLDAYLLRLL